MWKATKEKSRHETEGRPELVAILTEDNEESIKYGDGIESISSFKSERDFTAVTYNPWLRTVIAKNNRSDNTLYIRDIEK